MIVGRAQASGEEVRGDARDEFERDVEPHESTGQGQPEDEREERSRLHLSRQRRPKSFEGVPPRNVQVEEIHGGEMAQRLGDGADVGIDPRLSAGQVTHRRREVRREVIGLRLTSPVHASALPNMTASTITRVRRPWGSVGPGARATSATHLSRLADYRSASWPSVRCVVAAPFNRERKGMDMVLHEVHHSSVSNRNETPVVLLIRALLST